MRTSYGAEASITGDRRANEERGVVAEEESGRARDLARVGEASDWMGALEVLGICPVGHEATQHWCIRRSGAKTVGTDSLSCILGRDGPGHLEHRSFRSC